MTQRAQRAKARAREIEPPPERGPWFERFAWALPVAFSAAVSACRFEQGDVLYAERSAYGDWSKGPGLPWIQVLDPPRSARARGAEGDAGRFASSWSSPVVVEIGRAAGDAPERLETTQGRLFTCLWRGDPDVLEAEAAPPQPRLQAELQREIETTVEALRALLGGRGPGAGKRGRGKAASADAGSMLFVSSIDLASDASLEKAESIWNALAAAHPLRFVDAAPSACGVPAGDDVHPSVVVRGLAIEAADEAQVTAALKAVLYNPSSRASSGDGAESGRADRFSLARHGWLGPLVEATPDAG